MPRRCFLACFDARYLFSVYSISSSPISRHHFRYERCMFDEQVAADIFAAEPFSLRCMFSIFADAVLSGCRHHDAAGLFYMSAFRQAADADIFAGITLPLPLMIFQPLRCADFFQIVAT
jgi:hypothetical protein